MSNRKPNPDNILSARLDGTALRLAREGGSIRDAVAELRDLANGSVPQNPNDSEAGSSGRLLRPEQRVLLTHVAGIADRVAAARYQAATHGSDPIVACADIEGLLR